MAPAGPAMMGVSFHLCPPAPLLSLTLISSFSLPTLFLPHFPPRVPLLRVSLSVSEYLCPAKPPPPPTGQEKIGGQEAAAPWCTCPEGGRETFLTPEGPGSLQTTAQPDSEAPGKVGPGSGRKGSPTKREYGAGRWERTASRRDSTRKGVVGAPSGGGPGSPLKPGPVPSGLRPESHPPPGGHSRPDGATRPSAEPPLKIGAERVFLSLRGSEHRWRLSRGPRFMDSGLSCELQGCPHKLRLGPN